MSRASRAPRKRDAQIELTAAELAELDAALADADGEESVSSAAVLVELDRIAREMARQSGKLRIGRDRV